MDVAPDAPASSPESSGIAEPPALVESDAAEPVLPEDPDLTELADSLAAASNAPADEPRANESGELTGGGFNGNKC